MDYKDTQNKPSEETSTGFRKLKGWLGKVRLYGLRDKLILPYLLLTVLLAIIGTFIVIRLVAVDSTDRYNNLLYNLARTAADTVRQRENTQLGNLRNLLSISYVPQAVQDRDTGQLIDLSGFLLSNKIEYLAFVDRNGQEIISWKLNQNTGQYENSINNWSFSDFDPVSRILSAPEDNFDKHVGILSINSQEIFVTGSPVRNLSGNRTGIALIGTYLDTLVAEIQTQAKLADQVILLADDYKILTSTLSSQETVGPVPTSTTEKKTPAEMNFEAVQAHLQGFHDDPLISDAEGSVLSNFRPITLNGRDYTIYYTRLSIRDGEVTGWVGVSLSKDIRTSPITQSRNTLVIIFSIGTAAVIVIGYLLAQSIARPILKLRTLSQEVAAGDLNQHVGLQRSDEIGELAQAFDQMTLQLRERTDEAARLFDLTVQRNKELAYINARLQSMQLQLIQAEKLAAVGQLTAGIVHDVKNPLAVIKGLSEVLLGNDLAPEERQHLNIIHESAVKANTIVTDLLKFARQSTPEKKFQDLRETVEASLRLTAYLSRKANIDITKDLPERSVMMWYDSQQLEQVFINIITNAIQAMPEKGTLQVSMKKTDSTVTIAFKDNGTGIPSENLNRIFDPFFTTKAEGQGTGLGLSVSYGIISNHNGHIQVESKVGEGSTFTIILPIEQISSPQGAL